MRATRAGVSLIPNMPAAHTLHYLNDPKVIEVKLLELVHNSNPSRPCLNGHVRLNGRFGKVVSFLLIF